MTDLTGEELDKARGEEAERLYVADRRPMPGYGVQSATIAARLAREGWTPVDPDLVEARTIFAFRAVISSSNLNRTADESKRDVLEGKSDQTELLQLILAGIKRGRELASERAHTGGVA